MIEKYINGDISKMEDVEIYYALLEATKEMIKTEKEMITGDRKLYYISSEFLIGKLLSNNLINLGIYEEVKQLLEDNNKSLAAIEEVEPEPSLGNGGLGRLAACFIDSIATLDLPGDGVGLLYHFGLFKQIFKNNEQCAFPNPWMEKNSWINKTDKTYEIQFPNFKVNSRLYEIDVVGYGGKYNKLKLFDVESVDETLVKQGIDFDKEKISENLTLFLYPDDSDKAGHLLRIYQQYFMVANAVNIIFEEEKAKGHTVQDLDKHVVIQINDTHPTLVIPEMIRRLNEQGIELEKAIEMTTNMCAYTNHTILAEALEKWPYEYLQEVVPQLLPIINKLNDIVLEKFSNEQVQIIDKKNRVHMAHICIHFGFAINGVAALHTDILKKSELKEFYKIYPGKFNNKTNGITFRRWLIHSNPELSKYLDELIGYEYKNDADALKKLVEYKNDVNVQNKLREIKQIKKLELKRYIKEKEGIEIDENSIYDIQIKRLHEYKRQQMNALYIIHKYLEIKKGNVPTTPITFIFGAKAAPSYTIAQDIIHLILVLSQMINEDNEVNKHIKVVMVENYNVTYAEKLIPACNVSEQISLASKEASGTGNMKFMLNGALTLGTEDGANVEIKQLVGDDNIFIFGQKSDTVIELYEKAGYNSKQIYENDKHIKQLVDFIVSDEVLENGNQVRLNRLYNEILSKDWFMTLLDINDYIKVKEECFKEYENESSWMEKVVVNISKAGFFSSDRTIQEYEDDIWKLRK